MDRCILVVEDNDQAAKLFALYLAQEGYRVVRAASGEEALAAVGGFTPAAIVLDLILPGMDGWEVLRALKSSPRTWSIPVVIVSVLDRQTLGFRLGAAEHLVKPVERVELVNALQRSLLVSHVPTVVAVLQPHATAAAIAALFARAGYRFYAARAGREALSMARELRPDLMLFELPDGECMEALAELRAEPATREIPVLLLTARALPPDQEAVLSERTEAVVVGEREEEETLVGVVTSYFSAHAGLWSP